jgi:hypothetical protein
LRRICHLRWIRPHHDFTELQHRDVLFGVILSF